MASLGLVDGCAPICLQRSGHSFATVARNAAPSQARDFAGINLLRPVHRRRRCRRVRAFNRAVRSADQADDEPVNIDQLAKRLAQEASARRQQDQASTSSASTDDLAAELDEVVRSTEEAKAQATAEYSSPFGFEVQTGCLLVSAHVKLLCRTVLTTVCMSCTCYRLCRMLPGRQLSLMK